MRVTKKKNSKLFSIKHARFHADVEITSDGRCKIHLPHLTYVNKVYFGEIGHNRLREIAEVLIKVADLADKEVKQAE